MGRGFGFANLTVGARVRGSTQSWGGGGRGGVGIGRVGGRRTRIGTIEGLELTDCVRDGLAASARGWG